MQGAGTCRTLVSATPKEQAHQGVGNQCGRLGHREFLDLGMAEVRLLDKNPKEQEGLLGESSPTPPQVFASWGESQASKRSF